MARRPIRHTDTSMGWQVREFRALWKAIREMRAERRLGQSEVPEGGDLRIRGLLSVLGELVVTGAITLTGTLSMRNDAGQTIFRLGDMTYGRGLVITRDDGTPALTIQRVFSNSTIQSWQLWDRNGALLVSEGTLSAGLDRPRLEYAIQPVAASSGSPVLCGPHGWEQTADSDDWVTIYAWQGRKQNTYLDFKFRAMCSDATTAGEIRVVNLATGEKLAAFPSTTWEADVPLGTTTMTVVDPDPATAALPGSTGDFSGFGVQVRRTAGAGSITVAVPIVTGA